MKVQTNTFKKRTVSLISINYKTEVLLFFESHSILHEKKDEWWFDYLSKKKNIFASESKRNDEHPWIFFCVQLWEDFSLYSTGTRGVFILEKHGSGYPLFFGYMGTYPCFFFILWKHILVCMVSMGTYPYSFCCFAWFLWEHILIFLVAKIVFFYRTINEYDLAVFSFYYIFLNQCPL